MLHEKGMLLRCYTQNIDNLQDYAGLPRDKVVEAHGSFATASCGGGFLDPSIESFLGPNLDPI